MTDSPDVLVVGAGPVGLTVAAELARHGVVARIIDRAMVPSRYCRAIGVTPRTLETWEDMGIARRMIDAGLWITGMRSVVNGGPPHDVEVPEMGLPYGPLGIPQYETERVLAEHLATLGIVVERGTVLDDLSQGPDAVTVTLTGPDGRRETARFAYLVGCDGAHSIVRKRLDIGFDGSAYPWPFMLGDVHIDWDLPYGRTLRAVRPVEGGPPDLFVAIPLPEPGRYRVSMLAPKHLAPEGGSGHGIQAELAGPSVGDLQAVADDLLPDRPRLSDLRWSSIFRISLRLASRYRSGRAFIAGDAAHIHPPTGGQGMNTGIGDAYDLAWKLARVIRGRAPQALLDSYDSERRPVGAAVVARTRAASENYGRESGGAPDRRADAQVDISYPVSPFVRDDASSDAGGPRAGDRAPDVPGLRQLGLGFPLRLFDLFRGTDHVVLIGLGSDADTSEIDEISDWARRIRRGRSDLVRILAVTADRDPGERAGITILADRERVFFQAYGAGGSAHLIRPDGHVAWKGGSWRETGLPASIDLVCGRIEGSASTASPGGPAV